MCGVVPPFDGILSEFSSVWRSGNLLIGIPIAKSEVKGIKKAPHPKGKRFFCAINWHNKNKRRLCIVLAQIVSVLPAKTSFPMAFDGRMDGAL